MKPGEFSISEGVKLEMPKVKSKPKLEYNEGLISIYTAFNNRVHSPTSVLYPSCGFDASPSKVFENVVFVDAEKGNEGCVQALKEAGLNAIKQDIREYRPKQAHDLLILLNPVISHEWATRHLPSGGWIISNDYHRTASDINSDSNFSLWGTIDFLERDRRKKDFIVDISRNLEGLFEPVKDSEELKLLRPNEYKFIYSLVNNWVRQGLLNVPKNAPFEEKFIVYRTEMGEKMPSKRVANQYIFVKK